MSASILDISSKVFIFKSSCFCYCFDWWSASSLAKLDASFFTFNLIFIMVFFISSASIITRFLFHFLPSSLLLFFSCELLLIFPPRRRNVFRGVLVEATKILRIKTSAKERESEKDEKTLRPPRFAFNIVLFFKSALSFQHFQGPRQKYNHDEDKNNKKNSAHKKGNNVIII